MSDRQPKSRRRCAVIGIGHRSHSWITAVVQAHQAHAKLVALCDPVVQRCEDVCAAFDVPAHCYASVTEMLAAERPDLVVVTSPDHLHAEHIIAALEAGCDVAAEKPLCTTTRDATRILEAEQISGRSILMGFNYRHVPLLTRLKQLLLQGVIGRPVSMDLTWYLDYRGHGLSYFRRWHRIMQNSGGLLITKGSHHFDLANWLFSDRPVTVFATGSRQFFGFGNNPYTGTRCSDCPHADQCDFYTDVNVNAPDYEKLSRELGYRVRGVRDYPRDYCPFGEDVDIYDTMSVTVAYKQGGVLNYSLNAGAPFEGWNMAINGTGGRIETAITDAKPAPHAQQQFKVFDHNGRILPESDAKIVAWPQQYKILAMPHHEPAFEVNVPNVYEGHGGGDAKLFARALTGHAESDPEGLFASVIDGAYSVAVGDAANQSIRTGNMVRIDLQAPAHRHKSHASV